MKREGNTKRWRGSDNQRAILLTERAEAMEAFDGEYPDERELQLQQLANGGLRIIGIPRRADMEKLKPLIAARGLVVKEAP